VKVEEIMEAMIYFLVYVIENLMLPGQIENWNYIIDFGHMGISDLPLQVKRLFKRLEILTGKRS